MLFIYNPDTLKYKAEIASTGEILMNDDFKALYRACSHVVRDRARDRVEEEIRFYKWNDGWTSGGWDYMCCMVSHKIGIACSALFGIGGGKHCYLREWKLDSAYINR